MSTAIILYTVIVTIILLIIVIIIYIYYKSKSISTIKNIPAPSIPTINSQIPILSTPVQSVPSTPIQVVTPTQSSNVTSSTPIQVAAPPIAALLSAGAVTQNTNGTVTVAGRGTYGVATGTTGGTAPPQVTVGGQIFTLWPNQNSVSGKISTPMSSNPDVKYYGITSDEGGCQTFCANDSFCTSYTWFDDTVSGWANQCYGIDSTYALSPGQDTYAGVKTSPAAPSAAPSPPITHTITIAGRTYGVP